METRGISSYNPWHDRTVGNVTTDKIFILSAEEVIKYMLDDSGEVIEENGNYSYEAPGIDSILSARFEDGQHYAWWLRTVGKGDVATQQGSDAQDFISVGVHSSRLILSGDRLSTDPSCCVRPAMWITIDGSPAPTTPGATPTPAQLERIGRWDVALTLSLSGNSLEHSGIYSGDILNGLPHGRGSFTTQNTFDRKRVYTGEWNAGHLQGEGSLEHNNRLKFEGIFENDLMVSGKMYDLSGQLYYEGDFRDGLRIEDAAALQARINAYDADAIFLSGSFSYDWNYSIGESFSQDGGFEQYVGQIVAMEHEFFDIVPDGAGVAVTIRQLSPVGYTVANYYPAYNETFPQPGSKIRCYYRVYEDNGMVYRDLLAWTSI